MLPNDSLSEAEKLSDLGVSMESSIRSLLQNAKQAKKQGDRKAFQTAVAELEEVEQTAFGALSKVRHALAMKKVPYVVTHVEDLLQEGAKKVVVFIHHHDVAAALQASFGDRAVVLTGETPHADRQIAIDRFQNDPSVEVFIGAITAAGVGVNLTAASNVVFAELDWVPANMTQAEDRTHRIGQLFSVLVQYLVFNRSLEARIAAVLVRKQEISDKILDDDVLPTLEANLQTLLFDRSA
jgi:SWI/SNF-related matrix-associated actin-dependent regulator 1 of chromatin subfamily A